MLKKSLRKYGFEVISVSDKMKEYYTNSVCDEGKRLLMFSLSPAVKEVVCFDKAIVNTFFYIKNHMQHIHWDLFVLFTFHSIIAKTLSERDTKVFKLNLTILYNFPIITMNNDSKSRLKMRKHLEVIMTIYHFSLRV